ncbi:MAG: hypothetical protein QM781_03310 [Chitinophagaceae bacterium]
MTYTNVSKTGQHHSEILDGLDFYKEELQRLRDRLDEIGSKNTGEEVRKQLDHFESQFLIQRTNIDQFRHDFNQHYQQLAQEAASHAGHVSQQLVTDDQSLQEAYGTLEKVINELREEFNRFSATWM